GAGVERVQFPVRVRVAGIDHHVDRLPADLAAVQPYEPAQAQRQTLGIELLARRERVEIAGDEMRAVAVALDRREQRSQLARAQPLGPVRVNRRQMDAEHAELAAREDDLE